MSKENWANDGTGLAALKGPVLCRPDTLQMGDKTMTDAPDYAQVGDLRIAYQRFGRREYPALLLVMGLGTQMVAWDDAFCGQLAERGLCVVRFDNRDIGLSSHWPRGGRPNLDALIQAQFEGQAVAAPYTLIDMAGDTVGLMDALGIEQAHLAGISMGAMIGQEMAVRWPERLLTLTSIMSTTGAPDLPPPTPEALDILINPFPSDREGYIAAFMAAYRVLSGPIHAVDDAMTRRWAAVHYERGLNPDGIARQTAAILASGDRTLRLQGIKRPVLVLHGDKDPLLPVAHGRATAEAIPGARLEIIAGMGHAIPASLWGVVIDQICRHVEL